MRSSSVKRIMSELRELQSDNTLDFTAAPTEVRVWPHAHMQDNLYEWHFTMRGPQDTVFENGLYHGKMILPTEYPFKAPHVIFMTPNGRWSTDTKVCVTFTGFHEESWQPAWGIRTAMLGVQALMSSREDEAGYGAASMNDEGRKMLAEQYVKWRHVLTHRSVSWTCPLCRISNAEILRGVCRSNERAPSMLPGTPEAADRSPTEKQSEHERGEDKAAEASGGDAQTHSSEHAHVSGHGPAPTSLAGKLQEQVELYRRTISMLDSLMGLVCLMLILLVLKNL